MAFTSVSTMKKMKKKEKKMEGGEKVEEGEGTGGRSRQKKGGKTINCPLDLVSK